ncbi:MAG: tetratricopeptide repeat protein [Desulfobacterales bacterium]|jgi:tetratricopeptide (TPR) repeat protein
MTQKKSELFHHRSSSRQFLLCKSDPAPKDDTVVETSRVESSTVSKTFPNILVGEDFIHHAMAGLDSSTQFEVMVIRIDDSDPKDESGSSDDDSKFLVDMVKTIDETCKIENGMLGQLAHDMFGCFISGNNQTSSMELADKIKSRLAELHNETVSIGIASFPTLDFNKHQVIDNARKALDHAAFFGPDSMVLFDAVSLNISGDTLYQKGDIHGAIMEFKAALLLDPSNVNVHNSLGVCYGVLGDYVNALEAFEETIRIDPEEAMGLYNAGLANLLMENRDKALGYFLDADQKEEDIFEVAFQIGRLYLEMGKPEQAKKNLEKAIRLNPDSGIALRYLGESCVAINQTDEAISAYKKAVRQNPNDAESLSALGYLFDLKGENPEITEIFCQQSIDIAPENGLFRYRLGNLYLKRNQLEDALEQFRKAEDLGHDAKELIEKVQNLIQNA